MLSDKRQKIVDKISKLSNRELLEQTLDLATGDDYDGCFTIDGGFEFEMLKLELNCRLKEWLGDK